MSAQENSPDEGVRTVTSMIGQSRYRAALAIPATITLTDGYFR